MCSAEKCCFCVPLHLGCILLGGATFLLSTFMVLSSVTLLVLERSSPGQGVYYFQHFPQLYLNSSSVNIILSTISLVMSLMMASSIMLIVGIKKNKSSLLLSYFSIGIMLTILCMLSGLLVLLEGHWILALVKFLVSLFYIHCLIVVHTTYDFMQRGIELKYGERRMSDEAILVIESDEDQN